MAVTAQQIRELFGIYRPFVFELNFTGEGNPPYICKNTPIGWDSQDVNYIRNEKSNALIKSYLIDLEFVKEDILYIKNVINTFKYENTTYLKIYKLNSDYITYDVFYTGILELSKYELFEDKMKVPVSGGDIDFYIEANGDKEYTLVADDFTYNGIEYYHKPVPTIESAKYSGFSYFEFYNEDELIAVQPPLTVRKTDVTTSVFQSQLAKTKAETPYLFPFFISNEAVSLNLTGTFYYDIYIPVGYIKSISVRLCKADGAPLSIIDYNQYAPNQTNTAYETINMNLTVPIPIDTEVFIVVYVELWYAYGNNVTFYFQHDFTCTATQAIPPVITRYRAKLKEVLSILLAKATFGQYDDIVLDSDMLGEIERLEMFVTSIEFIKTQKMTAKLNDALKFVQVALGMDYMYTSTGITFMLIADNYTTDPFLRIVNPSKFKEKAYTQNHYSLIQCGCNEFNTEDKGGIYSTHEYKSFKTPIKSNGNVLDLKLPWTMNPFEIDSVFKDYAFNGFSADFDTDKNIFVVQAEIWIGDYFYWIPKLWTLTPPSSGYGIEQYIYNLKFSPSRILERHLSKIQSSLVTDDDVITIQQWTKNGSFYTTITGENTYYDAQAFVIKPRSTTEDFPFLTCEDYFVDPVMYEFNTPTNEIDFTTIVDDFNKLILVSVDGVKYAGYLSDITHDALDKTVKVMRLIKAHLTNEEIEDLWQSMELS